MKRIKKLKIKNFKAFKQEQVFNFKGKNVLVYGSNGSGVTRGAKIGSIKDC